MWRFRKIRWCCLMESPCLMVNQIMEIDPLKIEKLEVVTKNYFYGPITVRGVVSYTTYNGDLAGIKLDSKSVTLDYDGILRQREFYSPQYANPASRASRVPDQRYALYWNSNVNLTSSKPSTLEFYTSDVEGQFVVVVEGISENGQPGYEVTSFKVSR
jgi:hypothetical protein